MANRFYAEFKYDIHFISTVKVKILIASFPVRGLEMRPVQAYSNMHSFGHGPE